MRYGPGLGEDARNLTLIGVAGAAGLVIAVGLIAVNVASTVVREVRYEIAAPRPAMAISLDGIEIGPVSAAPLLYGTVHTRDGQAVTGFLRWDRNEGSWTDLLDANKARGRSSAISGVRFGHVSRIEPTGNSEALFTLKSGEVVEMSARATDLGSALRALTVESPDGSVELRWRDLDAVEFLPAPEDLSPHRGRLHGTLTTRSGERFTGYVTWDVDEIYTSDVLDGEFDGRDVEIPFGAIESIERFSSRAATVRLKDGREYRLRGSNDVDSSIRGISVSDPGLGQVSMEWDEFDSVRFHPADAELSFSAFSGGERLVGTVVTWNGDELTGEIRWDDDEGRSWEMLNGEADDVEFHVEFGQIARIESLGDGARVELRDGRVFELDGSNDVDDGNRGIVIRIDGRETRVGWDSFKELRMGW